MNGRSFVTASILGLGAAAGASVALAYAVTDVQRNPGNRPITMCPADVRLPFEDVTFRAAGDGLTISGWLAARAGSETAVVMVPGGGLNRLNGDGAATLAIAARLHADGHHVLLYDPRGTGRSDFARCSYGWFEQRDLVGAFELLRSRGLRAKDTGVLAWSMGASSAALALESVHFGALAIESPLGRMSHETVVMNLAHGMSLSRPAADLMALALRTGGFLAARAMWGMNLHRDPCRVLRSHRVPTLVIHGTDDRQIPTETGREVAAAAGQLLDAFHLLEGVGHVGAYSHDTAWYLRTLSDFFREALLSRPA